jgi:hypothetical protein
MHPKKAMNKEYSSEKIDLDDDIVSGKRSSWKVR